MSTPQLERLREHCHQLRLYQVENELTARLEQAAKKEISYAEFLDELLALEVGSKAQKHHQMRISIIITSNQSLGAWGEVFGDTVIASAILDRLLHHSITINIKGESFRLKEKLKAGLLKPKLDSPADA